MIRHDQPPLLITSEDTAVADAIRKGECALGGRLNSDPMSNGYQQSLIDRGTVTDVSIIKGRMCMGTNMAAPFTTKGKKKQVAKAFCDRLDLTKAAKLFEDKEDEPMMAPEPYEPGKQSYENGIKYRLDQLSELQSARYQVDRICREDKAFEKVKGVLEAAYARLQTEIKECADKHAKAKKSLADEPGSKLTKAIFVLTGMDHYDAPRPENAVLKDTHGEQFSSDADKEVVNYLTTVEKINLDASPAHNPWGQPAFHGFPTVQKSTAVTDALDSICKSGFASLASPMTNAIPKKAHVDVSVPKVSAVKTPKMAVKAPATPKSLASARPVKALKAGAKVGGKNMTAKSEADIDLYVMAFQ